MQVFSPQGDKEFFPNKWPEQQPEPNMEQQPEPMPKSTLWSEPERGWKRESKTKSESESEQQSSEPRNPDHGTQDWIGFSTGTTRTGHNVTRNNETSSCYGTKTINDTTANRANPTNRITSESSSPTTRHPYTRPVGQPKPMDPITVLNSPEVGKQKQNQNQKNPNKEMNICSWNIRRGLVVREAELKQMTRTNSLNIIFLVETDTNAVNTENDYQIQGFKTLVQNKKIDTPTRIICLVDEKMKDKIIIRMDLTSQDFPSLWLEIETTAGKNVICGGFYREWAPGGDSSVLAQVKAMQIFTSQIERAVAENKSVIILGDANLCCERWNSPTFPHKQVAEEIKDTIAQCGMSLINLGTTYTADRLGVGNQEITSSLDHIYVTNELKTKILAKKLDNSATDHVPIMLSLTKPEVNLTTKANRPPVVKRSMKNFTRTRWIDALRNQGWTSLTATPDIEEKTENVLKTFI